MALVRTTIDSYEPALDTVVNRTSGSLTINNGDLIVITAMAVGAADGVPPAITFTHTWTGVTFTALAQPGTDSTRIASAWLWWVKWGGSNVTGTYTINVTTSGERNVQVYAERYTSAGTVRQSTQEGGDIDVGGSVALALASTPLATSELMVIVSYRPATPFTHDYVVGEAGYTAIHDHLADDNAKGRVLTAAGTAGRFATLAFSPATGDEFDHAAIMIEVTQGDTQVALVPATARAGGRPVTSTLGATTMNLNRAVTLATAKALAITRGTITVTLVKAVIHLTPRPLDRTSGVVVALARRTLTVTARPVTYTIGSPQTVTLGRKSLTVTARPVTITRGVLTVAVARPTVHLTVRPVIPGVATVLQLGRRSLKATARPVLPAAGVRTVTLGRRSVVSSARPVTLTKGATARPVPVGALHLAARPVTVTRGPTARTAAKAVLRLAARPVSVALGARTVTLVRATRTLVARPLTVTRGAAPTVLLARRSLTVSARPVTLTRTPVSRTVQRATVAAVARPVQPKGSGIALTLGRRTLTTSARPVTLTRGLRTVTPTRAAVHVAARPVTVTRGARVVQLRHADLHVAASTGVNPDVVGWWVTAVGERRVLPEA